MTPRGARREARRSVPWTIPRSRLRRARDAATIVGGMAVCLGAARACAVDPRVATMWGAVACFYFVFYWRITQFTYWANATYAKLGATIWVPGSESDPDAPTFHILVAAYEAQDSIAPVLRAIHGQAYPTDRFAAWVITERNEAVRKATRRNELAQGRFAESAGDVAVAALQWRAESDRYRTLGAWTRAVTMGTLAPKLGHPEAPTWLAADLIARLAGTLDRPAAVARAFDTLGLDGRTRRSLRRQAHALSRHVDRVVADFARLLGTAQVYRRADVVREVAWRWALGGRLARQARRACRRLEPSARPSRSAMHGPLPPGTLRLVRSTQDVVRETIDELGTSNIHLLDPHNRGFKPGALNAAYRHLESRGLLDRDGRDVFFLIIDADSLLPSHALATIAREIRAAGRPAPIMQMASVPTGNFFSAGWYSRFVAVADALGAVGKWARSTRRRLKPDLHAGSGVVVPAPVARYIAAHQEAPWTETTLTEDARMIVGQFGMMNGARNTTRMAPCHLLEAVAAGDRFRETDESFWNQRRGGRWAVMTSWVHAACPGLGLHARFDDRGDERAWTRPKAAERIASRLRRASRIAVWTFDHFWWGIGGAIV